MTHDEAIDGLKQLLKPFAHWNWNEDREAIQHAITILQRVKWIEMHPRFGKTEIAGYLRTGKPIY